MPQHLPNKDYPATAMGISQALTNIIAALALDPSPLVASANARSDQSAAVGQAVNGGVDPSHALPGLLCSVVTAELVPLLQPIIFSTVTDQVFGSTAGLSQREQQQIKDLRRRLPGWWVSNTCDVHMCIPHLQKPCKDDVASQLMYIHS
jgi:hypothetical protein